MRNKVVVLLLCLLFVLGLAGCYIGPYQGGWTGEYSADGTKNGMQRVSGPGTAGQCPATWSYGWENLKLVPGTCH
jgi:hypothetical protein